jgi:tripartite-type tricarboxylate transporter receptor subunit TctC
MRPVGPFGAILAVAGALATVPALGQDYPARPIRILVPAQAGGIGDILPRILGQRLAESGTATIVVENRTGGAGTIAAVDVARAPPDGYLLLMGNQGLLAIRPLLGKVSYDAVNDFAPIVLMVTVPNILVVHPSVPAKSLQELIAYAKANPGKLSYASQGVGASGHIAGELFKQAAGVDITHVPYRGAAPAAKDLAAGHVSMMFDVVSLALGPIRSGTVRALGVAAKERVAVLPEVATLAEGGHPIEVGGMVWSRGAGRHAARNRRLAQSRGQSRVHHAGGPRPVHQSGRSDAARRARGVPRFHRGASRALRRGDPSRRHQGVAEPPARRLSP